jgi:PAS domain S-box-containing protein
MLTASLWILISDQVVATVLPTTSDNVLAQSLKGLGFVIATSLMLGGILYWQVSRLVQKDTLLRAQERSYRMLVDNSTDFILRFDRHMRHLYVNPALSQATGVPRETYLGKTHRDLGMNEPQVEIWQQAIQAVLDTGEPQNIEVTFQTVEGERFFLARLSPERYDGVTIDSVLSIIRDITDLKETTQRLRKSEARLKGIIDSQIDLVCRYTPEMTLTFVNDAYCDYFGYSREELVGNSFLHLIDETQHPAILSRITEILQNPQPDSRIIQTTDAAEKNRWIQWVDYGIVDADRNVTEIQAVGRDITIQKQAENDLRQTAEILQTIIDHIPVMIAMFDAHGTFQFVNDYWLARLGWTVEELRQHLDPLSLFYPDEDYRQEAVDYMLLGEMGWRDFQVHTKFEGILDATWANVRLSDGRHIGFGQDISERKQAQKAALEKERLQAALQKEQELAELKNRFMSMVSHEFRNPLGTISLAASTLLRYSDQLSQERQQRKLNQIMSQVSHLEKMLEELALVVRAEQGYLEFNPSLVNLPHLVDQIISDVHADTHDIHIAIDEKTKAIYIDPLLLHHILANLLSNAIKYSPPGSQITCRAFLQDQELTIQIEDEGIGIPPDDVKHLFDAYHRAANVEQVSGTGLGLKIVKDCVTIHGGTITVDTQLNRGTTFTILLPTTI